MKNIIPSFAPDLLQLTAERFRAPLAVSLSVTDRCQLSCSYCAISRRNLPDPDTESLLELITELKNGGCLRIGFTGGEPLLRTDIDRIISAASDSGLYVTLNTNGILLDKFSCIWDRVRLFFVSLDGPESVHASLRSGHSGNQVMKNIRALTARGHKVITTTVLCSENVASLPYILQSAVSYNFQADFELFSPHVLSGKHHVSDQELIRGINFLISSKKIGLPVSTSLTALKLMKKIIIDKKFPPSLLCFSGLVSCFIDTDLGFYNCFDLRGKKSPQKHWKNLVKITDYCDFCRCNGSLELNSVFSLYPEAVCNNLNWW